jgi:predicted  nucleic acid-binding Zn-ribbon protein
MEQLAALGVELEDQDSTAKSLVALNNELAEEKLAWEKAQIDAETLSWVVEELKKTIDQFAAQVPSLKTHVNNLNDKIADLNVKLHVRELSLKQMTAAKNDLQHQSTRLTKKLEGKYSSFVYRLSLIILLAHH